MSRCLYLRILQIFQVRNHLEEFEYFLNIKMLLRMNGDTSRWNCFEYNFYDREYKSFVQCVLFLLQYYILFSHSSANDDIIFLFLYYMEFVKLQQDGLSLKRFVCLIRHQICYMQSVLQHASFMVPVILQSNHWLRWCHRLQNTDQ